MRYLKGSIIISETFDFPLLLQVRNARHISQRQLSILLQYGSTNLGRKRLAWRLDRLARSEYIHMLEQRVHGQKIYSIAHKGLGYLEMMGYGVLSLPAPKKRLLDPISMMHSIELTDIRIALGKTGILQLWKSDLEVSSENIATGEQYAKDYDAIATLMIDGQFVQYGVEYERSTKAYARYQELRSILADERKLSGILYFVRGIERFLAVVGELEGAHPGLLFCCADGFDQRGMNALSVRISSEPSRTLGQALGVSLPVFRLAP
jgi:hypothetical protein